MKNKLVVAPWLLCAACFLWWSNLPVFAAAERPNILWITAEDTSPHLGCYGDPNARTPNLDAFAGQGVRYTKVHSVHPCCSPSRSALATGVFPTRLGTFQHRGKMWVSQAEARPFTSLLRAAGYYCFNGGKGTGAKTDYNFNVPEDAWDKIGSKEVEWRQRKPGQPFFGQLNLGATHQSQYGQRAPGTKSKSPQEQQHDPDGIKLPGYHPDTPASREIWAEYHERLTLLDKQFRTVLAQLENDALSESTIVFFFGDNGNGIPGGKVWLWEEGTHVPLLIRIPQRWRQKGQATPGSISTNLISFIDFAPTTLALAGVPIPDWMDGQAFLGPNPGPPRRYVFAARDSHDVADFDTSRMARDDRLRYIRNFMPHLGWDPINYSWQRAPYLLEAWRREAAAGRINPSNRQSAFFRRSKPTEELYDLDKDPYELRNLAEDPAYARDLVRLRTACRKWMIDKQDLGLLSQYELYRRSRRDSPAEMAADPLRNPVAELLAAADLANARRTTNLPSLIALLKHSDSALRRWGAIGLLALGTNASPAIETIEDALADPSPDVQITCAEAMAKVGRFDAALPAFTRLLKHESGIIRNETLLTLARIGPGAAAILPHLDQALVGGADRDIWSADNVPDTLALARAAIADPSPPNSGPLPGMAPLKARRLRYFP
jgi:uncharacterized sulfatase